MNEEEINSIIREYIGAVDVLTAQVRKSMITPITGMQKTSEVGLKCLQRVRGGV